MSMTTDESPIDIATIRPGQLVSGRFTNGGTFTDVPTILEYGYLSAGAGLFRILRPGRNLSNGVAEITAVRDPRPAWADDPTAILIDDDGDIYHMVDGGWQTVYGTRWTVDGIARVGAILFGHRVAEDES